MTSIPKNVQISRIVEAVRGVYSAIRRTGLVQLGGWPIWSRVRSSSAICRTELIQLGGWPSWSRVQSSSAIRRAGRVANAELDGVLFPLFNKIGIPYATGC
ncbi:hypothetical protein F2Q69_00059189 [Brassica cretica]|uniref:Uncharacterized protein n=1 Tax=Brassica cretica TaxID=69181 RepID=A0A8S9RM30_BRACR|nr:hypothetical protein F2Q69_00059189 [Brassica cretica]